MLPDHAFPIPVPTKEHTAYQIQKLYQFYCNNNCTNWLFCSLTENEQFCSECNIYKYNESLKPSFHTTKYRAQLQLCFSIQTTGYIAEIFPIYTTITEDISTYPRMLLGRKHNASLINNHLCNVACAFGKIKRDKKDDLMHDTIV